MSRRTIYSGARPSVDRPISVSGRGNGRTARARSLAPALSLFPPRIAQLLVVALLVSALAAAAAFFIFAPKRAPITQRTIDSAVKFSLENAPPAPSNASVAFSQVEHAVVEVKELQGEGPQAKEVGVGTGVVITEDGLVITNFHVIAGALSIGGPAKGDQAPALRIGLVFADGSESEGDVVSADPDRDLAVLKARQPPEELEPATLRSIAGLRTGDEVFAVGFPFGIGPSLSAGVVSGLNRSYVSPIRGNILTGLIQFDAASNPGNSGGPLVDRNGDVVGLVSSILNPYEQRVFIGIAFAIPFEEAMRGFLINPF